MAKIYDDWVKMAEGESHPPAKPNWEDIERCRIWKVLGVTECDNCETRVYCWGTESELG